MKCLRSKKRMNALLFSSPMTPGSRLTKEQCDPNPEPAFHRRYRGIVGSLGYLVNMTRPRFGVVVF